MVELSDSFTAEKRELQAHITQQQVTLIELLFLCLSPMTHHQITIAQLEQAVEHLTTLVDQNVRCIQSNGHGNNAIYAATGEG